MFENNILQITQAYSVENQISLIQLGRVEWEGEREKSRRWSCGHLEGEEETYDRLYHNTFRRHLWNSFVLAGEVVESEGRRSCWWDETSEVYRLSTYYEIDRVSLWFYSMWKIVWAYCEWWEGIELRREWELMCERTSCEPLFEKFVTDFEGLPGVTLVSVRSRKAQKICYEIHFEKREVSRSSKFPLTLSSSPLPLQSFLLDVQGLFDDAIDCHRRPI